MTMWVAVVFGAIVVNIAVLLQARGAASRRDHHARHAFTPPLNRR